jgi:hypothetical protein
MGGMTPVTEITCEECGQLAPVAQNAHIDPTGNRIEWPKVAIKPDGIYVTLICPACGERPQKIADRPM